MTDAAKPREQPGYHAANPDAAAAAARAQLRRDRIAAREALSAAAHARLSARVEAHLEREFARRAPGVVAFCWPIRREFDARALIRRLLDRGWRACMPVVETIAAPMRFRPWTPRTAMDVDPYGIPVPAIGADSPPPDIVLLPLVAFDAHGYRLGYGGGYFDRTLAALAPRPTTCGVGFELARTTALHPQPHDIPLDLIVTERGLMPGRS
ncbi:MAG: 5-formyltetrahydrofolate cyclo-ligase [Rhodocyclaceae bacterium]|nr:5-formyltetrahydrofolate cyclo-ligase [Rhodocyclaceae bacterium]